MKQVNNPSSLIDPSRARMLLEKWGGVLDAESKTLRPITDKHTRQATAMLLENQEQFLMEANTAGSGGVFGTSQTGAGWGPAGTPGTDAYAAGDSRIPKILIPMIRRTFPELITNEIVGVQPMSGPVGWAFDTEDEVLKMAKASAESTHNHPEGIKGAQASALCIYLSRKGETKDKIKSEVTEKFGYDLNFTCDGIRDSYKGGGTCQASVPQAIVAFLDGTDFEDCIRNAISIGGDSDTIACITGSIAEAYYGVPEDIYNEAYSRLSPHFKNVVKEFEDKYGRKIV